MADETIPLRYVDARGRYLIGYPARDFDAPAEEAEALIATGLYELPQPEPIPDAVAGVEEEGDN